MTPLIFWTFAIAVVTALACGLCGVMLVVKREAFVAEGLSHAVLPGIIFAYLLIPDRSSPWLVIAAGLSGLLMVWLVQAITSTRLVDRDAALGIVFSGLFSIGIIASNLKLKNIHFHAHCIIDGNLSLAVLKPFHLGELYVGPRAFVTMALLLLVLVLFIFIFFKELKLMAFDETTARSFGFRPGWMHSVWLALVSMTAVAAFETAGTVLVVALMITPAATVSLLTKKLSAMFWLAGFLSAASAVLGVMLALALDISAAGPISSVAGFIFLGLALAVGKR